MNDSLPLEPVNSEPKAGSGLDMPASAQLPYDLPLFLVGMMGAGKTTIGRMLARRLKLRFVDADQEIEARCGVKIPVIFEIEGEIEGATHARVAVCRRPG